MPSSPETRTVEGERARLVFVPQPWDTAFFGLPCLRFDPQASRPAAEPSLSKPLARVLAGAFVTAKIDTRWGHGVLRAFLGAGFDYIDTEVTLEATGPAPAGPTAPGVTVRSLAANRDLPYAEFGSAFRLTRFHVDPHIDDRTADRLWCRYLESFPVDGRHLILAAESGGELAGVVLARSREAGTTLDFVAVREGFRGRGVGGALIAAALGRVPRPARTETQIQNVGALNFYLRNGLHHVHATHTVLHRWPDGQSRGGRPPGR